MICLFHKTLAPEGQNFPTADACPTDEGWVDTPAAFVEGYQKPEPQVGDGRISEAARNAGFVPSPYPSHRYKKNEPDTPKTIATREDDETLEAAEPGVWKHTPDPKAWEDGYEVPAGPDLGDAPMLLTQDNLAELHGAKVADIVVKVSSLSSVSHLQTIASAEDKNPKGARPTVLKAIKARLAELKVPESADATA